MSTLMVESRPENLSEVTDFVDNALPDGCSEKIKMQVNVAIDEIYSNIANYAYPTHTGTVNISVDVTSDAVYVTFRDCGTPYNPLNAEDPDVTLSAEKRKIGGLGVYMVKKLMDSVSYEYIDGMNVLSFIKSFKGE